MVRNYALITCIDALITRMTEMEATGRILLYVLDAVRLMPVKIKLNTGVKIRASHYRACFALSAGTADYLVTCM